MPVATAVPQQVFSAESPLPQPVTAQTEPPSHTHTHTHTHTRMKKNVPWGTTSCCSDRYRERPKYFYHQNLARTFSLVRLHTYCEISTVRFFTLCDFFWDASLLVKGVKLIITVKSSETHPAKPFINRPRAHQKLSGSTYSYPVISSDASALTQALWTEVLKIYPTSYYSMWHLRLTNERARWAGHTWRLISKALTLLSL